MDELETYFENETRAIEWRNLRHALTERRKALKTALAEAKLPEDQAALAKQIAAMDKQIGALRIEEAAQQFAEDAIRVTVNTQHLRCAMEDDDGEGE